MFPLLRKSIFKTKNKSLFTFSLIKSYLAWLPQRFREFTGVKHLVKLLAHNGHTICDFFSMLNFYPTDVLTEPLKTLHNILTLSLCYSPPAPLHCISIPSPVSKAKLPFTRALRCHCTTYAYVGVERPITVRHSETVILFLQAQEHKHFILPRKESRTSSYKQAIGSLRGFCLLVSHKKLANLSVLQILLQQI